MCLSVLFVPVLAFLMLGERLAPIYYVGIALALCGTLVLIRFHLSGFNKQALIMLSYSVLSISVAMVLQAQVFESTNYTDGILMFLLGGFFSALIVMFLKRGRARKIGSLVRQYGWLFVAIEGVELLGVLCSQRATAVGPSVSFVAVIECSLPVFIMLYSVGLVGVSQHIKVITKDVRETLLLQIKAAPTKILSIMLIVVAVGVVQANG